MLNQTCKFAGHGKKCIHTLKTIVNSKNEFKLLSHYRILESNEEQIKINFQKKTLYFCFEQNIFKLEVLHASDVFSWRAASGLRAVFCSSLPYGKILLIQNDLKYKILDKTISYSRARQPAAFERKECGPRGISYRKTYLFTTI